MMKQRFQLDLTPKFRLLTTEHRYLLICICIFLSPQLQKGSPLDMEVGNENNNLLLAFLRLEI